MLLDQPMVGENLQDHLEFYVQYLMLARRMLSLFGELKSAGFQLECEQRIYYDYD